MNRRSFFGALAVAPIALPALAAKASAPNVIETLKINIDASAMHAEFDAVLARIQPIIGAFNARLITRADAQAEEIFNVEAQMAEHDLFDPSCLFKTGSGQ